MSRYARWRRRDAERFIGVVHSKLRGYGLALMGELLFTDSSDLLELMVYPTHDDVEIDGRAPERIIRVMNLITDDQCDMEPIRVRGVEANRRHLATHKRIETYELRDMHQGLLRCRQFVLLHVRHSI